MTNRITHAIHCILGIACFITLGFTDEIIWGFASMVNFTLATWCYIDYKVTK